jgi:hypothetical protein
MVSAACVGPRDAPQRRGGASGRAPRVHFFRKLDAGCTRAVFRLLIACGSDVDARRSRLRLEPPRGSLQPAVHCILPGDPGIQGGRAVVRSPASRHLRTRGSLPTSSHPTALPVASAGRRVSVSPSSTLNDPQPFLAGPQPSTCPARSAARCQCPCGLGWSHAPGRGVLPRCAKSFQGLARASSGRRRCPVPAEIPSAGRRYAGEVPAAQPTSSRRRCSPVAPGVGHVARVVPQEYSPPSVGCIP